MWRSRRRLRNLEQKAKQRRRVRNRRSWLSVESARNGTLVVRSPRSLQILVTSYLIWDYITAATPPNVRRSQRERFSPLEWWRNEKFVYGRSPDPDEGPLLVPLIKAIERPPKPSPVPLSKKNRGKRTRVKVKKEDEDEGGSGWIDGDGIFGAPRAVEEGMDEETEELGVVLDHATGKEIERRESVVSFSPGAWFLFASTKIFYSRNRLPRRTRRVYANRGTLPFPEDLWRLGLFRSGGHEDPGWGTKTEQVVQGEHICESISISPCVVVGLGSVLDTVWG
jgi:hypothetical protein